MITNLHAHRAGRYFSCCLALCVPKSSCVYFDWSGIWDLVLGDVLKTHRLWSGMFKYASSGTVIWGYIPDFTIFFPGFDP